MNKCKYCNKRIWLSNYWYMNCLEILVMNLNKNKEKKIMNKIKQFKYNKKLIEHEIKVAKKDKQLMKILKRLSLN